MKIEDVGGSELKREKEREEDTGLEWKWLKEGGQWMKRVILNG